MPKLPLDRLDAVIFDMDGVITRTADVHAAAWKATFDDVLRDQAERTGVSQAPFDIDSDYLRHVDGKPRRDGIRDFLSSRALDLPEGSEGDTGTDTIEGIAHLKNERFHEALRSDGVRAFESTIELIDEIRRRGVKTAVISSSRNCAAVLRAAGVADRFQARVSGVEAEALGIPGKPAPDIFLQAARELGVEPSRSAVVEDAISGVAAGRAGGFALVIGVNRGGNRTALAEAGADIVVEDLSEIELSER